MTYVADAETQARKLRAARMAAASAVGNGCDPDEVRQQVEDGIAEALALETRPAPAAPDPSTSAFSGWAAVA